MRRRRPGRPGCTLRLKQHSRVSSDSVATKTASLRLVRLGFAIVYPTRAALADALRRLVNAGIALEGASDHGVSECW